MPASTVAAIIATCNRATYLGQALDSVLAQSAPAAQVIVVDDGSSDATGALLQSYGDRIRALRQDNGGKSTALNRALPLVTSDYVWIFDDDDIALLHNIESHRAVLDAHPNLGFVYSGCEVIRDAAGGGYERHGRLALPMPPDDEIFPRMLEQNFMQQQGMLVRTACYRAVGPFNETLDRSQDYEMNLRLARRFAGHGLDAPSFLFREHAGARGRPGQTFAAHQRSERWVAFSRQMLPRLHRELSLEEFLPRSQSVPPLDGARRRRALLQRACIMARCGLWPEALPDLEEALLGLLPDVPLSSREEDFCRRMLGMFLQRDLAIEGLVGEEDHARRFAHLLARSPHASPRRLFAALLTRYAEERLPLGKKIELATRALALATGMDDSPAPVAGVGLGVSI